VTLEPEGCATVSVADLPGPRLGHEDLPGDALLLALAHSFGVLGGLVLHAAAFRVGGASVIAVGASGAGKSTITAAAIAAGGQAANDDLVVAGLAKSRRVTVAPLRSAITVKGAACALLPRVSSHASQSGPAQGSGVASLEPLESPSSFLQSLTPNRLWDLSVDRRLYFSRSSVLSSAECVVALLGATQPLLFASEYPLHREKLMPVVRAIADTCRGLRVRLGRRLLEEPEDEMRRLLELTKG
jgi:hypothetical protein